MLCGFSDTVERASIDEAYLDLTEVIEQTLAKIGQKKKTLNGDTRFCSENISIVQEKLDVFAPETDTVANYLHDNIPFSASTSNVKSDCAADVDGGRKDKAVDGSDTEFRVDVNKKCFEICTNSGVAKLTSTPSEDTSSRKICTENSVEESAFLSSLIPSLELLKTTWVKLPDDRDTSKQKTEEPPVTEEETLKKYELDETIPSLWTPNSPEKNGTKEAEGSDNKGNAKDETSQPNSSSIISPDKTTEEKEGNFACS